MNYYRRYSGDYLRDTSRLSMLEHGAYGLLLDYYYSEEAPLPLDHEEIYTMVRAMKPADRAAVEKVLGKYFVRGPDGYHNKRADHEIQVSKKARDNGGKGGRPKTGEITGSETENVTGMETDDETGHITGDGGGIVHPPTTNHQPPESQNLTALSGKPDAAHVNGRDYKGEAREILDYLNRNCDRNFRPVDATLKPIIARLKSGVTPLQAKEVVFAKCEQWKTDAKMASYLRPETLFNATKFESYLGELNG